MRSTRNAGGTGAVHDGHPPDDAAPAMGSPAGGISMRASLILGFLAVLLLTAAGIVLNTLYSGERIVRSLSTSILQQSAALSEQRVNGFFGIVAGINRITVMRMERGYLEWEDTDEFCSFVLPLLATVDHISGAGVGDGNGNAYNLVRVGDRWRSQEIRPEVWGTNTLWKEWSMEGELLGELWAGDSYDPRGRPWFRRAFPPEAGIRPPEEGAPREPVWTPPYEFYSTGEYGVTVAMPIRGNVALERAVYFDVALADLDRFVAANKPSTNGFTIVLSDDLEVLGWPGQGAYRRAVALAGGGLGEVAEDTYPLLREVLSSWREKGRPQEMLRRAGRGGSSFWTAMRTLRLPGKTLHVLQVIPEDDLLGAVLEERRRMTLVLGGGILVAVAMAVWLAARYTQPVKQLVARSEAIERLELTDHPPVPSKVLEVRQLAHAQARRPGSGVATGGAGDDSRHLRTKDGCRTDGALWKRRGTPTTVQGRL